MMRGLGTGGDAFLDQPTIPTPETAPQIHHHWGDDYPLEAVWSYLRNPRRKPEWVEMGTWCPFCRFTPGPVAMRMHLEATMGFAMSEEEAGWPEPVEDR